MEILLFAYLSKIGIAFYKVLINKFIKVILIHITGWFGLQTLYKNTFQRRMIRLLIRFGSKLTNMVCSN